MLSIAAIGILFWQEEAQAEDTDMDGEDQLQLEGGFKVMDSIGETDDTPVPIEG